MVKPLLAAVSALAFAILSIPASAQDFGQGNRRNLVNISTTDFPQGKAIIAGGERVMPPGARSPWHSAGGPKLLYVADGTVTVEGIGGQTLMACGPGPKICLSPHKDLFFFRNAGPSALKFVVIAVDPAEKPTVHEEVGQIVSISGQRVVLAIGDVRTSELMAPRREMIVTLASPVSVSSGDYVVTLRHNDRNDTAQGLVKLSERWR